MIVQTIEKLHQRFKKQNTIEGDYPLEMTLQAFCELHPYLPQLSLLQTVEKIWTRRQWDWNHQVPYKKQPFAAHNGAFARNHHNAEAATLLRKIFIEQTEEMLKNEPLDDSGRITHTSPRLPKDGRQPLLIDFMSGYASRLAEAAAMGGNPEWFNIAAYQFKSYAKILPHPESQLWHLGRGWRDDPNELCHGAWSRGHGWLMRGLSETLHWLPSDHPDRKELISILHKITEALARVQRPDGQWSTLLHRSHEESAGESSGTALIAYGLARAIADGHLEKNPWQPITEKAIVAVCNQVDAQGIVSGTCKGPGTLFTEGVSLYLNKPIAPDDHHGAPCILYGALGGLILKME